MRGPAYVLLSLLLLLVCPPSGTVLLMWYMLPWLAVTPAQPAR
jgi:hypothetical protein